MTVSDEIIALLQALNTPTLSNALEDLGIEGVIEGLPPAGPGLRCVGRAVTVLEMTGPGRHRLLCGEFEGDRRAGGRWRHTRP